MNGSLSTVQYPVLSADLRAVWTVLARHRGRQQAVGLDVVAIAADLSERRVQQAIAALIEEHGRPIGSACTRPMGYFVIETEEELAESLSQLTHRITALARRVAALRQSTTPLVLQQLALDMESEGHAA